MNYKISKDSVTPAYLQLYNQIKDAIINGVYHFNCKLPSKRFLAEETEVSIITVEHAYSMLCDEGYIEGKERSGYFVKFRSGDGFATAPKEHIRHNKTNSVQNIDFPKFPVSVLRKAIRKVAADLDEEILKLSPNFGCIDLREAIQKYLERSRNITVATDQIIIGSGAEYLYGLLLKLFGKNRVYAIEAPSYQKIEQVYMAEGVTVEKLKLGSNGIESGILQTTKASILHISPYSSFPSGVSASLAKRQEYICWVDAGDRYIIEDDFESEFSVARHMEPTVYSMALKDNVIYMNTFSQTISPSLRVGYMVLPKALVDVFQEKIGFYSCTVPTFIQYIIAELIDSGNFEMHINRVRRQKRKELNRLKSK